MKPIEEGCLALVIKSAAGNTGLSVTVGKFIGKVDYLNGLNRWEVDKQLFVKGGPLHGSTVNHADESQLMRIDGYQGQDEIANTKEKVRS